MTKSLLGHPPAAAPGHPPVGPHAFRMRHSDAAHSHAGPVPPKPNLGAAPPVVVDWYSPSGMTFGKGYSSCPENLKAPASRAPSTRSPSARSRQITTSRSSPTRRNWRLRSAITAEASVGLDCLGLCQVNLPAESGLEFILGVCHRALRDRGPSIVLSGAHIMKSDEDPGGQGQLFAIHQQLPELLRQVRGQVSRSGHHRRDVPRHYPA